MDAEDSIRGRKVITFETVTDQSSLREKKARYWGRCFLRLPFVMYVSKGENGRRCRRVAVLKRPQSDEQLAHPIKDVF